MKTLLKLELKKTRLWPCIFGGLAVVAAALAIGGMFLAIGHTSGRSDPRLSSLAFVLQMAMVILLVGFSLVAAALCNLVFIEPYTWRNLALTLSCPISRGRILLSKLVFVGLFTALSYLVGTAITLTVILLIDRLVGSLGTGLSGSLLGQVLLMLVTSLAGPGGVGWHRPFYRLLEALAAHHVRSPASAGRCSGQPALPLLATVCSAASDYLSGLPAGLVAASPDPHEDRTALIDGRPCRSF